MCARVCWRAVATRLTSVLEPFVQQSGGQRQHFRISGIPHCVPSVAVAVPDTGAVEQHIWCACVPQSQRELASADVACGHHQPVAGGDMASNGHLTRLAAVVRLVTVRGGGVQQPSGVLLQ